MIVDNVETKDPSNAKGIDHHDKGYAWVIMAACFCMRILAAGPDGIMGVMLLDLTHRFDATEMLLNTTVSLQYGVALLGCKLLIFKCEARDTFLVA